MKTLSLLALIVLAGLGLFAQNQGPIAKISKQLTDYFAEYPKEKVFIATDKSDYKPGETIWFRAFVTDGNNLPAVKESRELYVKLFDSEGKSLVQEIFKLNSGSASCDLLIPADLDKGLYFLCAYTSATVTPEEVSVTRLQIDPKFSNQWLAETSLKEGISLSGEKNELILVLRDISGEIQKNTNLKYQFLNGTELFDKGKLKTDANGRLTIPFTLPAKTNGAPFVCELSSNKDDWHQLIYLPSNLDPVTIRFYPEGGTLIPGVLSKIGFTAFTKWGTPVDIEGSIQNQEGTSISRVQTFCKGLGLVSVDNAANQKYKLVISGRNAQNQSIELPVPNPNGLALTVAKTDVGFISANLVFADKQKHPISLAVSQGSTLSWAADMTIEGNGRIKIPVENLPQGINQLSVFSADGALLAERIVYLDKMQQLKIELLPDKNSMAAGQTTRIKVRLTNEKDQPLSGNLSISVADQFRFDATRPAIGETILIGSELETPFSIISGAFKGKITNTTLLDVYLIANRLKGFNWAKILAFKADQSPKEKNELNSFLNKNFDAQLSGYLAGYAIKFNLTEICTAPDAAYFAGNGELFPKASKLVNASNNSLDNQRKMFSSSSSILDVIKTIKPYKIVNNQIVFVGSENSLNYQGGALIVLDGQQLGTDISALATISSMEVDHINVSTNAMDIQRYTGLNSVGVIEIFQKKAKAMTAETSNKVVNQYDGVYRIPNKFSDLPVNPKRDNRTTLLWIPEQAVDATGQFEFPVAAGKVISDFVIEVQGMSDNGHFGSGKALLKVEK